MVQSREDYLNFSENMVCSLYACITGLPCDVMVKFVPARRYKNGSVLVVEYVVHLCQ